MAVDGTAGVRLSGPHLVVRSASPGDEAALRSLLSCDGVRRWWGPPDTQDIDELVADGDPDTTVLVIEYEDQVIGLIQFHEEQDPMYRHAGIDIAIHDDHQRQGYGPEAIRLVVNHLANAGHHRIVIDPNAANAPAITAYERVGFRPVGLLRDYEWNAAENRWTDGLLMELLIRDLPEPGG